MKLEPHTPISGDKHKLSHIETSSTPAHTPWKKAHFKVNFVTSGMNLRLFHARVPLFSAALSEDLTPKHTANNGIPVMLFPEDAIKHRWLPVICGISDE